MTSAIPIGISQAGQPCYELAVPNVTMVDDEVPHYPTEEAARKAAPGYDWGGPPGEYATPRQLAQPCWTATSACGISFDEEGDGHGVHFETAEHALTGVSAADWEVRPDGVLGCDDKDCDECWGVPSSPNGGDGGE